MNISEKTKKAIFLIIVIALMYFSSAYGYRFGYYMLAYNLLMGFLVLINIYYLYFFYKKSMFYYKTPYYNKALVGMYVKFKGIVEDYNKLKSPIDGKICEYYKFKLKALWSVKAPSPSKGYITETKPLRMGHSQKMIRVHDANSKVLVDSEIPDGKIGKYKIRKVITDYNNPIDGFPSAAKYKTYRHINNYIEAGDTITIYGRLIKKKNGDYVITNTKHPRMPFVIYLGDMLKFAAFYKYEFIDKFVTIIILAMLYFLPMYKFLPNLAFPIIQILSVFGILAPFKKLFVK